MLIIWIPVGILILYVALHSFYLAVWDKKLSASIYFTKRTVTEGDELTLVEEVANAKRIPIPVLIMEYKLNRNIRMHGNENASVTDRTNVIEYFSLGPREKVLREHRLTAEKRGYYRIDSSDIEVPELFSGKRGYMHLVQDTDLIVFPRMLSFDYFQGISERLLGESLARRRMYEDVFSFRGIRAYAPTDPMSSINWKASARTGDFMVNLRDFTYGQEIEILLNLAYPGARNPERLLEYAIRIAYTIAGSCIDHKVPVSIVSNGRDAITGRELAIHAGSSTDHIRSVGMSLARLDLSLGGRAFADILRAGKRIAGRENVSTLMICSDRGDEVIRGAVELARKKDGLYWLCPLEKDTEEKAIPTEITFQVIEI